MDTKKTQGAGIDFNALRMFVAVADAASFSAAARKLNLPKWSVSRRVSELEAAMGVPLLHRTTRRVVLSPAGAALHKRVATLIASLEEAAVESPDQFGEPTGELRISAPNYFGTAFLADAVTQFTQRYPRVHCDLYLNSQPMDFAIEGFDVALRAGPERMKDSSLIARPACPIHARLMASPEYLQASGVPRQAADLAGHKWVMQRGLPSIRLESKRGSATFRPQGPICCDDIFFVREAVRAGAGIGVIPTFLVDKDLARGRLVIVLPQYHTLASYVYIIRPGTRELPRRVRAFNDFLLEYLETHPLSTSVV
ncbi:LysR family transcriptional regulator [Steroidobacter denitrificans]|uniref:LysR family transcriptional regulator n=1 Tax=Steroidobacter denitrificans TaxID=465721 RepID=UPI00083007AC|nr:LysR family transcriptional regulator [Steroidobacter denitrificans]